MHGDPSSAGIPPNPIGGCGGSSAPLTKPDCRLIELAARERWPIPDSTREATIRELASILEQPGMMRQKPRLYLATIKALSALCGLNLRAIDTMIKAQSLETLGSLSPEQLYAKLQERISADSP